MMLPTWNLINFPLTHQHAAMCHYYYYPQPQPQSQPQLQENLYGQDQQQEQEQEQEQEEQIANLAHTSSANISQTLISNDDSNQQNPETTQTEPELSQKTNPSKEKQLADIGPINDENLQLKEATNLQEKTTKLSEIPTTTSTNNTNHTAKTISTTTTTTTNPSSHEQTNSNSTNCNKPQLQALVHQYQYQNQYQNQPRLQYFTGSNPYQYLYTHTNTDSNHAQPSATITYYLPNHNSYATPIAAPSVYYYATGQDYCYMAHPLLAPPPPIVPLVQHVPPHGDYYSQQQYFQAQQYMQYQHDHLSSTSSSSLSFTTTGPTTTNHYYTPIDQLLFSESEATTNNRFVAPSGAEKCKLASHLISLLPIETQPSKTRQAYGMGKVWEDEFEIILGEISQGIVWKLLEVETNPNLNDQSEHIIVAYRGHYVVRPSLSNNSTTTTTGLLSGQLVDYDRSCCQSTSSSSDQADQDIYGSNGCNEQLQIASKQNVKLNGNSDINSDSNGNEIDKTDLDQDNTQNSNDLTGSTSSEAATVVVLCNDSTSGENRQVSSQSSVSGATDSGFSEAASVGGSASGQQTPVHSSRSSCASAEIQSSASSDCDCSSTSSSSTDPNRVVIVCDTNEPKNATSDLKLECNNLVADEQVNGENMQDLHEIKDDQNDKQNCGLNDKELVKTSESNTNIANGKQYHKLIPTRFRMFIDSAKVRFCCDECGHGWTSMKGRVVFWYELFELENYSLEGANGSNQMFGFCAYKLFGQQCDICKVEGRFERPMWYPEEVVKVLNNLCNKIGQVYFGFRTPAIDKQRRAGKPKTSHNSSLCQACHDGLCTDRK